MATESEENKKKIKKYCIARDCPSTDRHPNVTFFSLPKENERRRKWLIQVGRKDLEERDDLRIKSHVLCSMHFKKSSIRTVTKLAGDAVPESEDEENVSASAGPTLRFKSQDKVKTFSVETQTEPYVPEEYLLLAEMAKKRKLGEELKEHGSQQNLLVDIKNEKDVGIKNEKDVVIKNEKDVDIKNEKDMGIKVEKHGDIKVEIVKKEPEAFDELEEDVSR